MGKEGAHYRWTPPQQGPKETNRHYIAVLERTMRRLKQMGESGDREMKRKCQHRHDICLALRDRALMDGRV